MLSNTCVCFDMQVIKIQSEYPFGGDLPLCSGSADVSNISDVSNLLSANVSDVISGNLSNLTSSDVISDVTSACSRPDVFFLSVLEFLFTFVIALTLVEMKNSIFFPNVVSSQAGLVEYRKTGWVIMDDQ